jgi:hypothetical protein
LLRSRFYLREQISPTLLAFAIDDEAKAALVRVLGENPPWRAWYLAEVAKSMNDPGVAYAVYADLKDTANPPSSRELAPYLQNLVGAGRFEQAYLTWIHFLPNERRRNITYVYNGDFEYPLSGLPFDWMIGEILGATTEIVATPSAENGHVVRIEFANRRIAYRHLRKLLMLPPGGYQLTGMVSANNLQNERGLTWRIACAEMDKQLLGESPRVLGTVGWRRFELSFEVPHGNCRAQWLTLTLAARVALEEQIGGEVWFDDLAVERTKSDGKERPAGE